MNEDDARKTINQMIQFIENEAKEKAKEIIDRAQQEYNIGH
jgi:vacuolar-type H+-ATPase subunit E/Vma4